MESVEVCVLTYWFCGFAGLLHHGGVTKQDELRCKKCSVLLRR